MSEPWSVEVFIRVGGDMQRLIGCTDYPDSVPDLLRAAANVWESGRVGALPARSTGTSSTSTAAS